MSSPLSGIIAAIVTINDEVASGALRDSLGPIVGDALHEAGARVIGAAVPHDSTAIAHVIEAAEAEGARAIITVGGTGLSARDVTPEATAPLLARELPGIAERLRSTDAYAVPETALSRGLAGVTANGAIVVNVAGSPSAARAAAVILGSVLPPAFEQLAA